MTADYTIEATHDQAAAIERDGFLVVAGLTTEPCPECGGSGVELWVHPSMGAPPRETTCPTCNGDGTVPIVVEVVVPERVVPFNGHRRSSCCHGVGWALGYAFCGQCDLTGCAWNKNVGCTCARTIPARTLLRGTAEAVPVVEGAHRMRYSDEPTRLIIWPEGITYDENEGGCVRRERNVTHHFADVPRPEVGDTAWIIRGEG